MRDYVRKETVAGPFPVADPIATLADYYDVNGYELVASTRGPRPDELGFDAEAEGGDVPDAEPDDAETDDGDGEEGDELTESTDAEESSVGGADENDVDDDSAGDRGAELEDAGGHSEESEHSDAVAADGAGPDGDREQDDDPDPDAADEAGSDGDKEPDEDPDPAEADEAGSGNKEAEEGTGEDEADTEEDSSDEIMLVATFERGTPGAGWKTSNMTKLHSRVTARVQNDTVLIDYVVDAAGQIKFTDEDELFWKREAKTAARLLKGKASLRDWREVESDRAKEVRGDFISIGVWLALLIFLFIVMFVLTF